MDTAKVIKELRESVNVNYHAPKGTWLATPL